MNGFDEVIFNLLHGLTESFLLLDWVFIFFAKYLIYILVAVFLIYVLLEKNWKYRFYFFSIAALSAILSRGIITPLIRFFYENPRPFVTLGIEPLVAHSATSSFPSGHIAFMVPIALTLWLLNKRVGLLFLIVTFFVGIARVGVGVHWPTDIIAGILVGIFGFVVSYILLKKFAEQKKEN